MLSLFSYTYIIANLFRTYVIYKFMKLFFEEKKLGKGTVLINYFAFYFVITFIYICFNIPIIMLFSNILGLAALSFQYNSNFKQRFFSVMYIALILLSIESIISLLTGYINFPLLSKNKYSSIIGIISIQLVSYIVVQSLQNFRKIKSTTSVILSASYWINLIFIPFASLYIILILFSTLDLSVVHILISISLLLLINLFVFSLYDSIIDKYEAIMKNKVLIQQNNYYEKQYNLMQTSLQSIRAVRHDLINHLSTMKSLLEEHKDEMLLDYLNDILKHIMNEKKNVCSSNVAIDSILNFKLQEAEQKRIDIKFDLKVPDKLEVASFDMAVILGNLLDNAISAVSKLEEDKRKISFAMRYDKGVLTIKVKNYYNGTLRYSGTELITTKKDKENHGIGIANVKNVVKKYYGTLNINHNDFQFVTTIVMFVGK